MKIKGVGVDCCINGLDITISVVFNIPVDLEAIGGNPTVRMTAKSTMQVSKMIVNYHLEETSWKFGEWEAG